MGPVYALHACKNQHSVIDVLCQSVGADKHGAPAPAVYSCCLGPHGCVQSINCHTGVHSQACSQLSVSMDQSCCRCMIAAMDYTAGCTGSSQHVCPHMLPGVNVREFVYASCIWCTLQTTGTGSKTDFVSADACNIMKAAMCDKCMPGHETCWQFHNMQSCSLSYVYPNTEADSITPHHHTLQCWPSGQYAQDSNIYTAIQQADVLIHTCA